MGSVPVSAGRVLGGYRIDEMLGEGRMGVVFRAVSDRDGTVVALKVLRRELADDPVYLRRFAREGDIAARLRHPYVVPVAERGEAEGVHFLATRFVAGRSLAERLSRGPLLPRAVARLVAQVGGALDAVHEVGLVHRDVKPANVILTDTGDALLTDFGVARGAADSTLTQAGHVVGTVDYLAPEVIRGEAATPGSDLYALGCLAYECIAGAPPFAHRSVAEACVAHLREEPPQLRVELPPGFADALVTPLAKEPERRPATAKAYARLLGAAARAR